MYITNKIIRTFLKMLLKLVVYVINIILTLEEIFKRLYE